MDKQADISSACREYQVNQLSKDEMDRSVWAEQAEGLLSLTWIDSEPCELLVSYDECLKAINSMADYKLFTSRILKTVLPPIW